MSKHTPGPWTASGPHADGAWLIDAGDFAVCDVPTGEANARLIAAAPDLLAAADAAHDWYYSTAIDTPEGRAVMQALATAITRARGDA